MATLIKNEGSALLITVALLAAGVLAGAGVAMYGTATMERSTVEMDKADRAIAKAVSARANGDEVEYVRSLADAMRAIESAHSCKE